ncbi:MAG TPA: CDP-alcohol phosphatidyltransferase family protein [Candidatus Sulfotelmatobacter sp.]|nr:CDP-alcohol phosphatidyltransferase family protein [Candidatus Sulfotelmatobacter sp.]
MQAVIAIPEFIALLSEQSASDLLTFPIAGIPLLLRTVLTASGSGADETVLICPTILSDKLIQRLTEDAVQRKVRITVIRVRSFDPKARSSWVMLKGYLKNSFLWLPWNWVTTKQFLTHLPQLAFPSIDWAKPAHTTMNEVIRDTTSTLLNIEGVAVTSPETAALGERFLVAHSGKALDGIHTSFNRRLCRPFVRLLSHTRITPDAITFGGVLISVLAAIAFAHGSYWWYLLGAALFYIAGLFDEMDGMIARLKFAESPRGTWLEGFADGLSYLLLFGGITIGLSRQYGRPAILIGVALLIGAALGVITTSLQRRRATTPDRPQEYLSNFYQSLEKDTGNWISRVVRQVQAFQKRGVVIHYVVLFTIIGALPVLFLLATLGAHLTWILTLYFNRRFFSQPVQSKTKPNVNTLKEAS